MPYITPPRRGGRTSKVYSLFYPKQNNTREKRRKRPGGKTRQKMMYIPH